MVTEESKQAVLFDEYSMWGKPSGDAAYIQQDSQVNYLYFNFGDTCCVCYFAQLVFVLFVDFSKLLARLELSNLF